MAAPGQLAPNPGGVLVSGDWDGEWNGPGMVRKLIRTERHCDNKIQK